MPPYGYPDDFCSREDVKLTDNLGKMSSQFRQLVAAGGNDGPEDSLSAMYFAAAKSEWRTPQNPSPDGTPGRMRLLFLVTDWIGKADGSTLFPPELINVDPIAFNVPFSGNNRNGSCLYEGYPRLAVLKSAIDEHDVTPVVFTTEWAVPYWRRVLGHLGTRGGVFRVEIGDEIKPNDILQEIRQAIHSVACVPPLATTLAPPVILPRMPPEEPATMWTPPPTNTAAPAMIPSVPKPVSTGGTLPPVNVPEPETSVASPIPTDGSHPPTKVLAPATIPSVAKPVSTEKSLLPSKAPGPASITSATKPVSTEGSLPPTETPPISGTLPTATFTPSTPFTKRIPLAPDTIAPSEAPALRMSTTTGAPAFPSRVGTYVGASLAIAGVLIIAGSVAGYMSWSQSRRLQANDFDAADDIPEESGNAHREQQATLRLGHFH